MSTESTTVQSVLREKKVAVVGSRDWPYIDFIRIMMETLGPFVVISGGARGVDHYAEAYACIQGWPEPHIHYPDWEKYGKSAGFIRNSTIVADSDALIAFWDGKSRGTNDSINKARKAGLPLVIFGLDNEEIYVTVENCEDGQIEISHIASVIAERRKAGPS